MTDRGGRSGRNMAVQPILQLGNPALHQKSLPVTAVASAEVKSLVRDLDETLAAFRQAAGYGRGIAAPQIGVLRRLIFVRMAQPGFCGPLINPEIEWSSDERIELWDDCFSFPDLLVRVARHARVRVVYTDLSSRRLTIEAEGGFSELLQHEIDHLDGILAVQRAVSPHAFATRSEWTRALRE